MYSGVPDNKKTCPRGKQEINTDAKKKKGNEDTVKKD